MVAWTNLFPLDPIGGAIAAYGRSVFPTGTGIPAGNYGAWYYLRSPGTVDTNIGLRFQYWVDGAAGPPALTVWGAFAFDAADVTAAAGRYMTGTAYLAPASAFAPGVVPTPQQIIDEYSLATRLHSSRLTAGTVKSYATLDGLFGLLDDWDPNTKYWVVVLPTFVANMGDPVNPANDTVVGTTNTIGRAMSVWTNRTPLAPKIISPSKRTTAFPGGEINFQFVPQGADRIASFPGDIGPTDLDDVAGVQMQYAPAPTAENPDPEWLDLLFNDDEVTQSQSPGWYLDQTNQIPLPAGGKTSLGSYWLWQTYKTKISCAPLGWTPLSPELPSGDWQVRVRTFDYGHPYPNGTGANPWLGAYTIPPLGDSSLNFRADTYPEANTSPWSEPVFISISEQVPKPTPLSPSGNIAVVEGSDVTLSWYYHNTYGPVPWPQARRTVQIKKTGDDWTTLVDDEASASASLLVTGFDLVSGNQYQWRVMVEDEAEVQSQFSDPAVFWMVPVPDSGGVIPDPSSTIEGATLGCGTHRVEVYRRGGLIPVGEITGCTEIKYGRLRDDISTAEITVRDWSIDCGNMLAMLEPWAYEIVIFRDNGNSVDRVWEGPITLPTYKVDEVVIQAKDVMAYAYRRIIKQQMSDTGDSPTAGSSVTSRAGRVMQNIFAADDPNILQYMHVLEREDDAKQYRSTPAYSRTGFEEIDDMASNAGLDYTAVGRSVLLWGTKHRIGTLPEFRDADLGNAPIVSVYGMSMANVYAISDGNGVYGVADRLDEDGKDDFYGLVEMLSSTWASDAAQDTGTYTQEGLETVRESFVEAAEKSIDDRYPVPVVVRVPDNTRLNPSTVISLKHLVPGVIIPLRSTGTLRSVVASQKLDSVSVTEVNGEETITVVMSPFNRDDLEVEAD